MTVPARLDPLVRRPRPGLLVGGSPLRVLRLSDTGTAALDALLAGRTHPGGAPLADRLDAAGLLWRDPDPGGLDDVTVVVPVRGTAPEVQLVLDGVPAGMPVVVVDDGSPEPLHLSGCQVLRSERSTGPAAARNRGAARATSELVAFVDADVRLPAGWLERLTGHFADPRVVAVAPRVVSGPAPGAAGVLEQQLCALDLGPDPGTVRPGARLSYVPSTALVVRRSTFVAAGGFDEGLVVGEDVDLVWRLCRAGVVRYDPAVVVEHGARRSLRAALRRRYDYGCSAGPLDVRHPGQVRHLVVSPWSAGPWLAGLVHPAGVPAVAAALVLRAPRALPDVPPDVARRLVVDGQLSAARAAGRYAVRAGLPLVLAAALASRRVRRMLPVVALAYAAAVAPDVRRGRPRSAPARAGLRLLDDLAYASGVWTGCVRSRRLRPLLPELRR